MEADDVKRPHKASDAAAIDGIQNGEAQKTAVGEHNAKLHELCMVDVLFPAIEQERGNPHHNVHSHADQSRPQCDLEVLAREGSIVQCSNDHHGLTDGNDQLGEIFGRGVVDDSKLAADISANE